MYNDTLTIIFDSEVNLLGKEIDNLDATNKSEYCKFNGIAKVKLNNKASNAFFKVYSNKFKKVFNENKKDDLPMNHSIVLMPYTKTHIVVNKEKETVYDVGVENENTDYVPVSAEEEAKEYYEPINSEFVTVNPDVENTRLFQNANYEYVSPDNEADSTTYDERYSPEFYPPDYDGGKNIRKSKRKPQHIKAQHVKAQHVKAQHVKAQHVKAPKKHPRKTRKGMQQKKTRRIQRKKRSNRKTRKGNKQRKNKKTKRQM